MMDMQLLWVMSQDIRAISKTLDAQAAAIRSLRKEVRALKKDRPAFDLKSLLDHWGVKLALVALLLAANWELKDILKLLLK